MRTTAGSFWSVVHALGVCFLLSAMLPMSGCAKIPADRSNDVATRSPIVSPSTVAAVDAAPPRTMPDEEPETVPLACGGSLLMPGTQWVEELKGTYDGPNSCYGSETPWVRNARVTEKVIAVVDGHITKMKIVDPHGRVDFLVTADGGVLPPDLSSYDDVMWGAPESSDVPFPRVPREIPAGAEANDLGPVFLRALSLPPLDPNMPQFRIRVRSVGSATRTVGTVRAFAVTANVGSASAGLGHHWTTTLKGTGALYLAADEDVVLEANFHGVATTEEGTSAGCGPDRQRICPDTTCARGKVDVDMRIDCSEASAHDSK